MNIFEYFNTAFFSCLIIVLIAVDYLRKYNSDKFQRKLLIIMLISIFFAALFDYISLTIERYPGDSINNILKYTWSVYLIARNCTFYYGAVFIDYFAHGNVKRTKGFFKIVTVFLFLLSISIIFNIKYEFYFYISRDNIYIPGSLYILQTIISFLPIFIILADASLAPKYVKRSQILLTIVFVILSAVGAVLDIVLRTTNLIWPCVTAAILYIYFFIIKTDSKIDTLTGIGNRNSFIGFLHNFLNQATVKEHAFIMLDIDRFREINEKLGHAEGDNALRDMASIIKSCTRNIDFAACLGGDEFVIVTTGTSNVQGIIDRINDTIDTQNKKQIRPYQLSISYCHDVYKSEFGWRINDFLVQLENEMYRNKELRREKFSSPITHGFYNKLNTGEKNV